MQRCFLQFNHDFISLLLIKMTNKCNINYKTLDDGCANVILTSVLLLFYVSCFIGKNLLLKKLFQYPIKYFIIVMQA